MCRTCTKESKTHRSTKRKEWKLVMLEVDLSTHRQTELTKVINLLGLENFLTRGLQDVLIISEAFGNTPDDVFERMVYELHKASKGPDDVVLKLAAWVEEIATARRGIKNVAKQIDLKEFTPRLKEILNT